MLQTHSRRHLPYDIIQEDGEYCLLLQPPISSRPNHTIDPRPKIIFSSFDELRVDIQTANFTQREWNMLYYFGRASSERFERKIPIFNHIYVPILPESAHMGEISWHGRSYTVSIECEEASFVGFNPFSPSRTIRNSAIITKISTPPAIMTLLPLPSTLNAPRPYITMP